MASKNDVLRLMRWNGGCLLSIVALIVGVLGAPMHADAQRSDHFDDVDIGVLHVRGDLYMLVGAGANITVQVGADGVLLVDTMHKELSEKVLSAIRTLSDEPIRYILNTHAHPDHVGGNKKISQAGRRLTTNGINPATDEQQSAAIIAHENVLSRMAAQNTDPEGWPFSTYFTAGKSLYVNGEAVILLHQPNAHTDGDSIIHFRGSDVISAGDLFSTVSYPYIDVENSGTIRGIIDGLNRIIEIAIPSQTQQSGTMVIPGHGRLADEIDVVEYRDMLSLIVAFIQEMIDEGRSLREVQSARPTEGWDFRYGTDSGIWTTEQFVEAIYRELTAEGDG